MADGTDSKFQNDLTQGRVTSQLIRFSAPFLLSMLIQQCYSMADLLIVSFFSGDVTVAGVNNGGQLTFLATALGIGLSVGGTILIGQYFGAKQTEEVRKTAATMLTALLLVSVVMTALFIPLSGVLLRALRVPEASFSEARTYLIICTSGLPFIFLYNAISGILRGLGDAKRPLIFVAGACILNVILDVILVAGFGMGAAGVAVATIISQAGSVVVSAIYLARGGFLFDFKPGSFVIHRDKLKLILKLGIPASFSQVAVSLSFLLMAALVNGYGVSAAAAAGLAGRFNGFAIMPAMAVSQSVAMMSAQNLGANRHDRALHTMKAGMVISLMVGGPVFAAAQFIPRQIMGILSASPAVIDAGAVYMKAFSWDYLLVPFCFCFFGLINGAGHAHITMINTLITSVALRIPAALLLSHTFGLGLTGVGLAAPVASAGGFIFLLAYILSGRWRSVAIHRASRS
ncbi:MAG: MATE family efflux transporter [Oscillospiraceae bacterium]|nr:MATE family efflux transporter [Oscillospiraceae bacterium]